MTTQQTWNVFAEHLKNFIAQKVSDKSAVDDLLQETFIKIHSNINKVNDEEKLEAWVFSIARNVINDYYRKQTVSQEIINEHEPLLEDKPHNHEAHDCLEPLIKNLEPKYKNVMLLSEIKGLKHQQVADELGISLSAAKSRVLRGRELLKGGFMDCCDYKLNEKGKLVGEAHTRAEDCKVCS